MDRGTSETLYPQSLATTSVPRRQFDSLTSPTLLELVRDNLNEEANRRRLANQLRRQNVLEYLQHKKNELAGAKARIDESARRVGDLKRGLDVNSTLAEQLRGYNKGLSDQLVTVQNQLQEAEVKATEERQKLYKLRQEYVVYQKQHHHSKEEYNHLIKSYSDRLGVKLESIDGVVKFVFTLIDDLKPDREFCCTIRLSKAPDAYKGIDCQPFLHVFPKLINLMNEKTLEIGGFICLMRRHFKGLLDKRQ